MKAVHLTSAHWRNDIRVFVKECSTLDAHGWDTTLIVADGKGDATASTPKVLDVGAPRNRLDRMLRTPNRILGRALDQAADVYHFHDPELIPIGLRLKSRGKRVVFDSHEDTAKSILGKTYLRAWLRPLVAWAYGTFERWACRRFDAIVAATPSIGRLFASFHPHVVIINNYPLRKEFAPPGPWGQKSDHVCYIGQITGGRGIAELVRAMALTTSGVRLQLAGRFTEPGLRERVAQDPGWANVDELGQLDRPDAVACMERSLAGIVTLLPMPNHTDSQPTKMFEYMGAGIPVIASDFPVWQSIVEEFECGVCVDPADPGAVAAAIDRVVSDPPRAERMGRNGRRAVESTYNWESEGRKLLALYQQLVPGV